MARRTILENVQPSPNYRQYFRCMGRPIGCVETLLEDQRVQDGKYKGGRLLGYLATRFGVKPGRYQATEALFQTKKAAEKWVTEGAFFRAWRKG